MAGDTIRRSMRAVAARQDLALVLLLILIVFMIIVPLPTWLIDLSIGFNLAISVLILVVALYLRSPTTLSTLPSILLFSTLFRLAISISTTRLILLQADAGQIVESFGKFVIGGSLVVGIVVFLIITIVQFIVITKGSERVAEVSARFSLDALPGKQMAIDSDMRAGEIDMAEARRRRQVLQTESEFYGAMDGAMKFVKGDAIASLIIIAVNIIGGLGVGVGQMGMSFSEALHLYSVLTVGDGMVSQIPALLMAISSGIVITRIANDASVDLAHDITAQVSGNPRALQVAAVVLVGFGLIPGFPTIVFLVLAFVFGAAGFLIARRNKAAEIEETQRPVSDGKQDLLMAPMAPVLLAVGPDIAAGIDRVEFEKHALRERTNLFEELGVPFPKLQLWVDTTAPKDRWQLMVENVPVAEGHIPAGRIRLTDDADAAQILGVPVEDIELSPTEPHSYWCDGVKAAELTKNGVAFQSPAEALVHIAARRLPRHAAEFLGVQEVGALMAAMESRYDSLVAEAQKALSLQKIATVMRRLVEEEIPVRNLRVLLETIVDWAPREKDPELLSEYVRTALARQISYKFADQDRFIAAYIIEADIEGLIRSSIRNSSTGEYLSLEAKQSRRLLEKLRDAVGDPQAHAVPPVFISTTEIRRFLRRFLATHEITFPVLSHKEIAPSFKVQPIAMLSLQ